MKYKNEILEFIQDNPGCSGKQIINSCMGHLDFEYAQNKFWALASLLKNEELIHRIGKEWFAGKMPQDQIPRDTWTIFFLDEETQTISARTHLHNAVSDYRGMQGYIGYQRGSFTIKDLSR